MFRVFAGGDTVMTKKPRKNKAPASLDAGAKRVVISAPAKDKPECQVEGATVLMGINEDLMSKVKITSNASCTTNAAAPFMAVLDEKIGIEKAILNTVHGYTSTQSLICLVGGHMRRR